MSLLILDLCGGTGAWSKPYKDAGYEVDVVDLPVDIRLYEKPKRVVHGILAAPPCTYFCRMRMCRGRPTAEQFKEGLSVVDACLRVICVSKPKWWALENPQGYLKNWLGDPVMQFEPWQFGDAWTKKTWLWGNFTLPISNGSSIPKNRLVGNRRGNKAVAQTFEDRSRTPSGFAQAFFEFNP